MEPHQPNPYKQAMIYGLYLAGVSITLSVIIWATSLMERLGLYGSMAIGLVNLAVFIYLLIYFTKLYRDEQLDGRITFGQAFAFGIMIVVFSTIVSSLYNYIFARYIDPEYAQRIMTMMQEKTYQMMVNNGMSEDQIENAMKNFEEQPIPTPIKSLVDSIKIGLIGGAIMSLISSAIVKKNKHKDDAFDEAMEEVKTEE